jgi:DNA-binding FrmR family transcriptional regulator
MQAEKQNIKRLLNTARGQIDGLNKMIDDDKYCIDISNQIMSTIAILKKVNIEILDAHLKCCVLHSNDEERATKIEEISEVLKKALK